MNCPLRVECYSGYRADERPRRFLMEEKWIEVVDILDRWLAPNHRYFKIVGNDHRIYLIRHDVDKDLWELHAVLGSVNESLGG